MKIMNSILESINLDFWILLHKEKQGEENEKLAMVIASLCVLLCMFKLNAEVLAGINIGKI